MRHKRSRRSSLAAHAVALLLGACSSKASPPAAYAGDAGSAGNMADVGGASGSGGSAGAAGAAGAAGRLTTGDGKERCRRPEGWPTIDSVLSMAEALPDTGDVDHLVMTSRGLHWFGDVGKVLYRLGADGKPVVVAMTDVSGSTQLVASDSAIVWLWGSNLWALSLTAGAVPAEIGKNINLAGNPLLVDDTHAYFELAFASTGGLTRIPLAGGAPERVPAHVVDVIAVHDGYAYYRWSGTFTGDLLMRARLDGTTAEQQVDDSVGFLSLARTVFDANVMYVATTRITRIDLANLSSGTTVMSLAPAPQQGTDNYLTSMVLDGDRLVYADGNGTVGWVKTDGSQCANILVYPDQGKNIPGWPIEVTLDDKYLYMLVFSDSTAKGSLHRIARSSVGL